MNALNNLALTVIPTWNSSMAAQVFPMNLFIELEMPPLCEGGDKRGIVLGGRMTSDQLGALNTLVIHEVTHVIFRQLGFSGSQMVFEEGIADYFASASNNFTPYIGEGLGSFTLEYLHHRLNGANLSAIEKVGLSFDLSAASEKGMRDFTKHLNYSGMYRFPEIHNNSAHFNSMFFQMGAVLGYENLARIVLGFLYNDRAAFVDNNYFSFLQKILNKYQTQYPEFYSANLGRIENILRDFGWQGATAGTNTAVLTAVMEKASTPNTFFLNYFISKELTATLLSSEIQAVNLMLKLNGQNVAPATVWVSLHEPKIIFTETPSCRTSKMVNCLCDISQGSLELTATYLGKESTPKLTLPIVPLNTTIVPSSCYQISLQ